MATFIVGNIRVNSFLAEFELDIAQCKAAMDAALRQSGAVADSPSRVRLTSDLFTLERRVNDGADLEALRVACLKNGLFLDDVAMCF